MSSTKSSNDIPAEFESLDAAAEWWDTHSVADFWSDSTDVEFDISRVRTRLSVRVEPDVAEELIKTARREQTTVNRLVDRLLRETLTAKTPVA